MQVDITMRVKNGMMIFMPSSAENSMAKNFSTSVYNIEETSIS